MDTSSIIAYSAVCRSLEFKDLKSHSRFIIHFHAPDTEVALEVMKLVFGHEVVYYTVVFDHVKPVAEEVQIENEYIFQQRCQDVLKVLEGKNEHYVQRYTARNNPGWMEIRQNMKKLRNYIQWLAYRGISTVVV